MINELQDWVKGPVEDALIFVCLIILVIALSTHLPIMKEFVGQILWLSVMSTVIGILALIGIFVGIIIKIFGESGPTV